MTLEYNVPIDILAFVEVVKGLNDTGHVKSSNIIVEWALCVKSSPQVTAHIGVREQVNELFV